MARLFWIKENQCHFVEFEDVFQKENLKARIKNQLLILEYNEKNITLKNHEFFLVEECIFGFDSMKNETWYLTQLSLENTFGRHPKCSFCLNHPLISNFHAKIEKINSEYWIRDLNSTNKVYVNNNKVSKVNLKGLDIITILDTIMIFIDGYMIINRKIEKTIQKIESTPIKRKLEINCNCASILFEIKDVMYEIQTPVNVDKFEAPSLFSSIGSSIMIILSSILSSFVLLFFSDFSNQAFYSMIFSSISMSISFLAYGLINRRLIIKKEKKKYYQNIDLYLQYLKEIKRDLIEQKAHIQKSLMTNQVLLLKMNENNFGMFLNTDILTGFSFKQYEWIHFSQTKISYQNKNQDLYKQREELMKQFSYPLIDLQLIHKEDKVWIQQEATKEILDTIFMQLCWLCPSKQTKIIFLDPPFDVYEYLDHPMCTINHKRLLIKDSIFLQDILSHAPRLYDLIFLVFDPSWISSINLSKYTLFYITNHVCNFRFDHVLKDRLMKVPKNVDQIKKSINYLLNKHEISFDLMEIDIQKNWKRNKVCLDVEIGRDKNNQPIRLDLSEQGYGPHGLIAGTTGSGKSEWLSNLLMMLLLENSSQFFQYILIDFKGEAFGQAFSTFSHCAGILSNLDHGAMERFSLSMNYEIQKRQKILKDFMKDHLDSKAHIDDYNSKTDSRFISHLFVIVDEFAQLKSKYPEYMTQLIEMARIGRSLGIHLLLSTQKPMGIVDEQIWSNSNLKVCLKVNSESDSREILHNDKASRLKEPGEFIMQGSNTITSIEGKAYYLHTPIETNQYFEVDVEDKIIGQSKKQSNHTLYQSLCEKIHVQDQDHHYILLPDLKKQLDFDDGLIRVDMPYVQKQITLELPMKTCVLTHEPKLFIMSLLARYHVYPIYMCGFDGYDNYIDERFTVEELSLKISLLSQDSILMLSWVPDMQYFKDCKAKVVYFMDNWQDISLQQLSLFDFKIAYSINDTESVRLFFDNYKIKNVGNPLIFYDDHLCECIFCKGSPCPEKKEKKKIQLMGNLLLIGIDYETGSKLFYSKKNPLAILYIQKSCKQKIEDMIQEWKKVDSNLSISSDLNKNADIYLLYMPLLDQTLWNEKQFDMDLLWMGLGFMEYSYCIKRSIPIELKSQTIYWKNNDIKFLKEALNE